jgi:hypothetical protein
VINAIVKLDKPALSDVQLSWQVSSIGARPVSADDFVGGTLPSGQVTVKAGQSVAIVPINIKADSVQEFDETFGLILGNASNSYVNIISSPVFRILNDDSTPVGGTVRYWSGNKLVSDVGLVLAKKAQSASADDSVMVKNVDIDAVSGTIKAEIWFDGTDSVSNLNMALTKNGDSRFVATLNPVLLDTSQWSTFVNDTAISYKVSGISLSAISGPFKIMDVVASISAGGAGVGLSGGVVGTHVVQETPLLTSWQAATDMGQVGLNVLNGTYVASLSKRPLPDLARDAIDSRDALLALKMATGAMSSNQVSSKYQYVAADVDGNGLVQVKDAWAIARYTIGLGGTSRAGEWIFSDSAANVSGLSSSNALLPAGSAITVNSSMTTTADWTGIAIGDVDGNLSQHAYLNW